MNKQNKKIPAPVLDADGYQTNMTDLNGEPLPDLAALHFRPLHGGARPGAGRKPAGRVPLTLRLRPAVADRLRAAARKQGKTLSELAEERLSHV